VHEENENRDENEDGTRAKKRWSSSNFKERTTRERDE
jgi:hypothetical protein